MTLKLGAGLAVQAQPVVALGNAQVAVVGRLAMLVRHLQKDKVGKLLQ